MSQKISSAFEQLENICKLAKHQRNNPNAEVSLEILKKTADKLLWEVWNSEFIVAQHMVKQVEWS